MLNNKLIYFLFKITFLFSLTTIPLIVNGNCIVDFPGNSNLNYSSVCNSTNGNVEIGRNIPLSDGDSFTFDSPSTISIGGIIKIFAAGNGKIIIPEGVTVVVQGNLQIETAGGGCESGAACNFEFIVDGFLIVDGNLQNKATSLIWTGTGIVDILSNFDNTNSGCMECGATCPEFINHNRCNDINSTCSNNFCELQYGKSAFKGVDNLAPKFDYCPSDLIFYTDDNSCTALATWPDPQASDNSGTVTISDPSIPKGQNLAPGTYTVNYTATDGSGNKATCSFNFEVIDNVSPSTTFCPEDIIRYGAQTVQWTEPKFSDNCEITTIQKSHTPGSLFDIGSTTVTYTAKDKNGNQTTCSFKVVVQEENGPEITFCPDNIILDADQNCESFASWDLPTANMIEGIPPKSNYTPGQLFQLGSTNVVYEFIDITGKSYCSFDVIIIDNDPPVYSNIPKDTLIKTTKSTLAYSWEEPIATDNCEFNEYSTHKPGDIFPEGITTVSYTATDNSGNETTVSFNVTIKTNHPPVIKKDTIELEYSERLEVCPTINDPDGDIINIKSSKILLGEGSLGDLLQDGTCLEFYPNSDAAALYEILIEVCDNGTPQTCSQGVFFVKIPEQVKFKEAVIPYKIFTPDNDSYNDVWVIENIESYPNNHVTIYDRWGRVIYDANGYNNVDVVFDGSNINSSLGGSEIPTGTYFFNIVLNGNQKLQGYVELLR
ncbi:HYR domain-containing protein [Marinigracilibium pacificum]|uniref:HYR domain-containing protein n=1 Tax=Marinigracilibium pacificum TaxID=2729599 RepID=A0A848J276_9BACT|nr:HYR domain-containing protein [Marinigracilibium pacificum]NMM49605.1 HYR domain-containing protein [Marinigracilibium pacificum]